VKAQKRCLQRKTMVIRPATALMVTSGERPRDTSDPSPDAMPTQEETDILCDWLEDKQ